MTLHESRDPISLPNGDLAPGTVIEFTEDTRDHDAGEQYWYTGLTRETESYYRFDGYNTAAEYHTAFTAMQLYRWRENDVITIQGRKPPRFTGTSPETPLPERCRFKNLAAEVRLAQIAAGELPAQTDEDEADVTDETMTGTAEPEPTTDTHPTAVSSQSRQ